MSDLEGRPLPQWFDDAKLGIFVHWTAAAVPGLRPGPRLAVRPRRRGRVGGGDALLALRRVVPELDLHRGQPGRRAPRPASTATGPTTTSWRSSSPATPAGSPSRGPTCSSRPARATWCSSPSTTTACCCGPARRRNPHKERWASARDLVGRAGRSRAGAGPALRHLLLRRPRLDLRRPAHDRLRVDVRRHPADRGVPRLRRRPLARAHRPLPARRALERHRLPGRRRPRAALRATTTPRCPTASSTTASTGWPRPPGASALRLRHARVLDQGRPGSQVGEHPGHRHLVRVQPRGVRRHLPGPGRARPDVRRRRRPRRQPPAQRRPHRRRRHPLRPGPAPPRPRVVAAHQRRRHLRRRGPGPATPGRAERARTSASPAHRATTPST